MNVASELEEVQCESLASGSVLDVETHTRHYRVECLERDQVRISGHPQFCPEPIPAKIHGSLDREGEFRPGVIAPGMRLLFRAIGNQVVTTSEVTAVRIEKGEGR